MSVYEFSLGGAYSLLLAATCMTMSICLVPLHAQPQNQDDIMSLKW